jgi:hypothetical protein
MINFGLVLGLEIVCQLLERCVELLLFSFVLGEHVVRKLAGKLLQRCREISQSLCS